MSIIKQIEELGVIPVVVLNDPEDALPLGQALIDGGLPCAEVTFRTEAAAESIRRLAGAFPAILVGAGTVLTTEQVEQAAEAGAKFIVSPGLNEKVVRCCQEKGLPVIPGCMDTYAIEKALELGLDVVKFFPAEACGGVKMIKALSGPYRNLRFVPTGGINTENLASYLQLKQVAACGGSFMVKEDLIEAGRFDEIRRITAQTAEKVKEIRK